MSLDLILSLAGLLFAVLGALAALVSYVFDSEWADVLVPFFFFGLLACQTVRLICYQETDALAPMLAAGFAILVWLVALTRRNGDSWND